MLYETNFSFLLDHMFYDNFNIASFIKQSYVNEKFKGGA